MADTQAARAPSRHAESPIPWGRVLVAGLLSEASVVVLLVGVMTAYSSVIAPGRTDAEYDRFGELAAYYVAPAASALATFAFAVWAARRLQSRFVATTLLVGIVVVLLTTPFIFVAPSDERVMYVVSGVLKLAAGYAAGLVAERMAHARRAAAGLHAVR